MKSRREIMANYGIPLRERKFFHWRDVLDPRVVNENVDAAER